VQRASPLLLASLGLSACGDVSRTGGDSLFEEDPAGGAPEEGEEGSWEGARQVLPPPVFEVPPDQIVDGSRYDSMHPSLSGDLLSWVDLAGDEDGACYRPQGQDDSCDLGILAEDLSTGERKEVTRGLSNVVFPRSVDGEAVAWTGHDGRVHVWDFATGRSQVVSDDEHGGQSIVVAGDGAVAWFVNHWSGRGVWVWSRAEDRTHRLPLDRWMDVGSGHKPMLAVQGTTVAMVGQHQRNTGRWWQDLWVGDIATRDQAGTWMEPPDDGSPYAPALAGSWVVFKAWFPDDAGCNLQTCEQGVFSRSLDQAEGLVLHPEGSRPSSVSGLVTAGPRVAWLEVHGPTYRAVAADLATGDRLAESPSGARPVATSLPALSARWLMWTDAGLDRLTIAGVRL